MGATLIDGVRAGAAIRADVAQSVAALASEFGIHPGLAVVIVGDDPASHVYVRSKSARTVEAGMRSFDHRLPMEASEAQLLDLVARLNADDAVDGILVQLPLPPHMDPRKVIEAIDPKKDVDGFHPTNAGLLATGAQGLVPCTPLGSLILLKSVQPDLAGLNALVIGRSNIVGRPMATLLLNEGCTVTIAHSRTRDLPGHCRDADIVVAAVGRAEMVRGDWIKPGAIVIDVGINRVPAEGGKTRLVGDVAFADVRDVAGAITPVPGGVGPMTIACLLRNTLQAACARRGLPLPQAKGDAA